MSFLESTGHYVPTEYPDVSDKPSVVYLNVLDFVNEITSLTTSTKIKFLSSDLEVLISNIVQYVSINGVSTDNLYELADQYQFLYNTENKKFNIDSTINLILKLGENLTFQFKALGLYAIDDVAYYEFTGFVSIGIISLALIDPVKYYCNM